MRVILRIFAVIGILSVLLIGGLVALVVSFMPGKPAPLPDAMVLSFDFGRSLSQGHANDPVSALLGQQSATISDVVGALNAAAKDPRIKGLVARVGDSSHSLATTQELRDAIDRFRKAGKFAIAHAETFGETGTGMQAYYLASAFDEVWLQPLGDLSITGMRAELPFYRGTLDKLAVEPQFEQRKEYKSFAESYTRKEPSAANREATESLVGDLFEQWLAGVSASRSLPPDSVRAAVDRAPLLDKEAVEAKLVDRLGYWDEAVDAARERAGLGKPAPRSATEKKEGRDGLIGLLAYREAAPPSPPADAPVVALIIGSGAIVRGSSEVDPLSGEASFGAAAVARAFQSAIDDPDVKAILFRVDSPGGSAVASEVVRRQVQKARAAGKPVVVSMADVAASGGYWVSMGADRIVAQPGTITGSIGVVAGKIVAKGLMDMVGVSTAPISRGRNAGMWSGNDPFTPSQLERLNAQLDSTYAGFLRGVSEGRQLPLEKVEQIARGRVYTGRQAKELGLVDALGGYDVAMKQVRDLLGLPETAPLAVLPLPRPKNPLQTLMALASGDESEESVMQSVSRHLGAQALADLRPVLAPLAPVLRQRSFDETVLLMPPLTLATN